MGASYANLFIGLAVPNLNFTAATSMIALAQYLVAEKTLTISSHRFNSFHPALKDTRTVSECSIAFFNINVSISGHWLSTSVHYKPTDSHSYLLHSSSHPAHVKNSIPYSQFLRLRRLCSDDTDFSEKQRKCGSSSRHTVIPIQLSSTKHRAQSVHRALAFRHSEWVHSGQFNLDILLFCSLSRLIGWGADLTDHTVRNSALFYCSSRASTYRTYGRFNNPSICIFQPLRLEILLKETFSSYNLLLRAA